MIMTSKKQNSSSRRTITTVIRSLLLDLPILVLFLLLLSTLLLQHVYTTLLTPLINSYKRHYPLEDGSFDDFRHEFTYYNRHCSKQDITTNNANDLLIHPDYSEKQAADVMLRHGAVAVKNLLSNQTASQLRAYLAQKHPMKHTLPWNEVFWDGEDGTRLSLGIQPSDHAVIKDALQEIGRHKVLQTTLRGILNDDPAIVEINTLTCMYGAHDQGIHTDSDWFGSSLMYGRTFLHSYSMFVALQDTPESMGATTVCAGSHYCADEELEAVCLQNGAFSVSTNGETGKHGVLQQGDGFLFNQNIWHRGPKNVHPSRQDRMMLILTFVSRNKQHEPGVYRRRQGLGTYYYQRWDMWGATFDYLNDAGTTMTQPASALRALGLYQPPNKNIGILWIEQFAQQLANANDFYDDDELADFKNRLWKGRLKLPEELHSSATRWEDYIPETMEIWKLLVAKVYAAALCVGLLVSLLLDGRSFWKRFVWMHGIVCLLVYALWIHIGQTDMAKTIKSGDVFLRPFPRPQAMNQQQIVINDHHPSTFPERHDILVGTRYDADFLASFNRFLDFHPGNQEWLARVANVASLPMDSQESATRRVVLDMLATFKEGLPTRFLLQDPDTGAWRIMTLEEAVEETRRAALSRSKPLIGRLATHVKHRLADSRFGARRDSAMARKYGVAFATKWLTILFRRSSSSGDDTSNPRLCRPPRNGNMNSSSRRASVKLSLLPRVIARPASLNATLPSTRTSIPSSHTSSNHLSSRDTLQPGDRVWASFDGSWYEATLLHEGNKDEWTYEFALGGYDRGTFRHYSTLQEGDRVMIVEYDGESYSGTITLVHPDGKCSILFDDNESVERIPRDEIWLLPDEE